MIINLNIIYFNKVEEMGRNKDNEINKIWGMGGIKGSLPKYFHLDVVVRALLVYYYNVAFQYRSVTYESDTIKIRTFGRI